MTAEISGTGSECEPVRESTRRYLSYNTAERVWYDSESPLQALYVLRIEPHEISLEEDYDERRWTRPPFLNHADRLPCLIICCWVFAVVFSVIATPVTLVCFLPGIAELHVVRSLQVMVYACVANVLHMENESESLVHAAAQDLLKAVFLASGERGGPPRSRANNPEALPSLETLADSCLHLGHSLHLAGTSHHHNPGLCTGTVKPLCLAPKSGLLETICLFFFTNSTCWLIVTSVQVLCCVPRDKCPSYKHR